MIIGVPKEIKTREYRVGMVPGTVKALTAGGHTVLVESGAGAGLRMSEIKWLLGVVVDVVVQFERDERGRFISEIYYEPRRQRLARWVDTDEASS